MIRVVNRVAIACLLAAACGSAPPKPPPPSPQPSGSAAAPAPPAPAKKLDGMFTLGECDQVDGTAQSAALYDKACTAKDGVSCDRLAGLYMCGKGVTRDPRHAVELDARA